MKGHRANSVRIIGGRWRGRRIDFADDADLRPTPDRVRETLFNWLAPSITEAHCLDLFAGSGVLGLEALSRGAARVTMIDQSPVAAARIRAQLAVLAGADGIGRAEVIQQDAMHWLQTTASNGEAYDVVFIDPPFASDLALTCCRRLAGSGRLRADALVYIESAAPVSDEALPAAWAVLRQKRAGNVHYCLCRAA